MKPATPVSTPAHRPRRRRSGKRAAGEDGSPLFQRRRTPPGAPPGTLILDAEALRPRIHVISYNPDDIEERDLGSLDELPGLLGRRAVTWVDVQGLGDIDAIRTLGEIFSLHGLALEDVVNVHQRPKVEDYRDHLFIVARMPANGDSGDTEQLALFLGDGYVLTFQARYGDCFESVRHRLRGAPGGRIRTSGSDYLAYTLIDSAIDGFFPLLERYGEIVEDLETDVVERPDGSVIARIHGVKRSLLSLRRAVWPQREMINALIRDDTHLMTEPTKLYLRDCYDHAIQLLDIIETYREVSSGLVDVYLSSVSARMNEVIKVLTIIATIFMPLSFVASLYGMNFDTRSPWNMPELGWSFGYLFALGIMVVITAAMVVYFRTKGWIGRVRGRGAERDGA